MNLIENIIADTYFYKRNKESHIVSLISKQGHEIINLNEYSALLKKRKAEYRNATIHRPKDWSGFIVFENELNLWNLKSVNYIFVNGLHIKMTIGIPCFSNHKLYTF